MEFVTSALFFFLLCYGIYAMFKGTVRGVTRIGAREALRTRERIEQERAQRALQEEQERAQRNALR